MPSLLELRNLFNDSAIRNKVDAAVIVAAQGILNETTPSTARKAWAAKAFANPRLETKRIVMSVLAANKSATLPAINGASDTAVQNNVNSAINLFIDADAGV